MKYLAALLVLSACGFQQGSQGARGQQGPTGQPGPSGGWGKGALIAQTPATAAQCPAGGTIIVTAVDENFSGVIDVGDSHIQASVVCSGLAGQDAPPSAFTPVKAIAPCGPGSAQYKEVVMLLADGSLLSSFSDSASGQNTRLTLLPDGNYNDTDGSNCSFSVSTNGSTRSLRWAGGSESWGL